MASLGVSDGVGMSWVRRPGIWARVIAHLPRTDSPPEPARKTRFLKKSTGPRLEHPGSSTSSDGPGKAFESLPA